MKFLRTIVALAPALLLVLAAAAPAAAQCAMCRAVVENSANAAEASRGLNLAALVLLVPPVTLFSGLFYAIYRFRNVQGQESRRVVYNDPVRTDHPGPGGFEQG